MHLNQEGEDQDYEIWTSTVFFFFLFCLILIVSALWQLSLT